MNRFSYELHIGPIPDGLDVLHHCDNPPCMKPAHLYAGTHQENMRDRTVRNRAVNVLAGENRRKTHCKHGHEFTEANTMRQTNLNGRRRRRCRTCTNLRIAAWYKTPAGKQYASEKQKRRYARLKK